MNLFNGFVSDIWSNYGQTIKDLFNSSFITSVAGALFGAFFGATAAQRIADRNKLHEQSRDQIRLTNTAISLVLASINSVLALETQHVDRLRKSFDENKATYDEASKYQGEEQKEVVIHFDLETLDMPFVPADRLETLVLEKLNIARRAAGAVIMLKQSVLNLTSALNLRNDLIDAFKRRGLSTEEIMPLYFGLKRGGVLDQNYPSVIDAIYSYTKDVIFFSKILCDDLVASGRWQAERYASDFRTEKPHINFANFSKAIDLGLIPSEDEYASWMSANVVHEPKPKPKRFSFGKAASSS